MPFIAAAIGAVVGAIGSAIGALGSFIGGLGFIGKALITMGLNVASALIQQAFAKKPKQMPGGVQFERQYGADVPRHVACGLVGIAGHDCYINTYGSSNKYLQQVYTISDYPCDGLSRVAINGKWATLSSVPDPEKGFVVATGEYAHLIWFKFIDGRQTTADPYLVGNANPASRWTEDHIGVGIAGVLVSMTFDQEKNNQFPDFFFEFRGARLYDWRKDSTVGGSGAHRWNDPSTHEFSENPIVIEYNYRRGFSVNGDLFCGMDMPASDLPLDKWTAAANICDENVGGEARYRCSILLDCMSTHGSNIESIALSCGAMTVDGVEGSWPLVGSDQPTVVTFTDDDLITTAQVRYRAKRSQSELVNSVSGNFPDPDNLWSMVGYEPQVSAAHVALDRRTRDLAIDFPQVRSGRQAAQLASIYLYENRYEATATVTLRPRFQVLEPGDWVRWNSKRYGDKVYIVTETQLMSLDSEGPRNIQLSLQERDGAIYDAVSPPPIIVPTPPGMPVYLNEVQDFALAAVSISGADGRLAPAIRASWSLITDETVTAVEVQYYPTDQPASAITKTVAVPATVTLLAEGIISGTDYTVKTKLVTDPARVTAWSVGKTMVTDIIPTWPGLIEEINEHTAEMLAPMNVNIRDLIETARNVAREALNQDAGQYLDRQSALTKISSTYDNVTAEYQHLVEVATGPTSALGLRIETLEIEMPGKASVAALNATNVRVTDAENALTVQGSQISGLEAALPGKADVAAVNQLQVDLSDLDDVVTAQGLLISGVEAKVDGVSASGLFRTAVEATEAGALSTIGLSVAATAGGPTSQAAMLMSARSNGKSMIGFLADMVYFKDPAGKFDPFVIEGGAAYFNNARIRGLTADSILAKSLDANEVLQNGTLVTQLLAFDTVTTRALVTVSNQSVSETGSGNWSTLDTLTFNNENPNPPLLNYTMSGSVSIPNSTTPRTAYLLIRIRNTVDGSIVQTLVVGVTSSSSGTQTSQGSTGSEFFIDFAIQQGNSTYVIEYSAYKSGGAPSQTSWTVTGARLALLCWKR